MQSNPIADRPFTFREQILDRDATQAEAGKPKSKPTQLRAVLKRGFRRPSTSNPSGVMLALTIAQQQLRDSRRENRNLKEQNKRLARALTDAAVRGTEARRIAHHDDLTGLPNRLALLERLQASIAIASRQQHKLALLFMDLDGFKAVNDRFGHGIGDELLVAAATRITNCIRADDFACRYGGDEFVVLLSSVHEVGTAVAIAEKIRAHIGERFLIDGREFYVTASIGVALYPADGERSEILLSCADASMYRSKIARQFSGGNLNIASSAR